MPLPTLDFPINAGLYTKSRQDDVSALLLATNVDYFDRAGGVGKMPGTQRRSNTASGAWKSIHHHDGHLSGVLTRLQVGQVGTTLQRVATDQSLLSLRTGLTNEPLYGISSQDRLHLASANNTAFKVALDNTVSLWGIAAPASAPTATKGSAGNVDAGSHRYVVTYVTTYGKESNHSSPSATVQSTGSRINLTSIPVSSEAQVVSRKIYRDDGGDQLYRLVATIGDNSTTTYEDNFSNADLSSSTAPEEGGAIDNSPPELMSIVAHYEGFIFGVLASDLRTVVFTEANEPEYWPAINARTFNTDVQALCPILGGLLICGSDWIVAVTGGQDGSRSLDFSELNPQLGCVGPRAITRVYQAVFLVHDDGPYLTTNGQDSWYLGTAIRDLIDALDKSTFAESILVHDRARFRVLWLVDGECLVYSYGNQGTGQVSPEGVGVDPLDLRIGKWSRMTLPASITITAAGVVETTADTPEVWLGASSGVIYRITTDAADYAVGSLSEAISATVKTTFEKIIAGPDKHGMARYLTIEGRGDAASTWTATLTPALGPGGSVRSSVSRTVTIGPGLTSKKFSIPRGYQGSYFQLELSNAVAGETGVVEKARLHFVPRPERGER